MAENMSSERKKPTGNRGGFNIIICYIIIVSWLRAGEGVKMPNIIFNRFQYQEAKKFLSDATVLHGHQSPTLHTTTYLKNGREYYEYESKLEAPEDDYYVEDLGEHQSWFAEMLAEEQAAAHAC
jgi:hypothetical protein